MPKKNEAVKAWVKGRPPSRESALKEKFYKLTNKALRVTATMKTSKERSAMSSEIDSALDDWYDEANYDKRNRPIRTKEGEAPASWLRGEARRVATMKKVDDHLRFDKRNWRTGKMRGYYKKQPTKK
jgi:hypothetical protein